MQSAFVGTFLDPYLDDDARPEEDLGNSANSLASILESISRKKEGSISIPSSIPVQLRLCAELSKVFSQAQNAKSFLEICKFVSKRIRDLSIGDFMFVPGGWRDGISQDVLAVYVIQKVSKSKVIFTTCDTSRWSARYQERSYATLPKVKRKMCLTLKDIDLKRVTDPVFILTILSLRRPVESHRVEMLYDVLLPWLAQRSPVLPEASTTTSRDDFRTISRAYQTSGYRSLLESVRFVLKPSRKEWKQLTYHIREELLHVCDDSCVGTVERRVAERQLLRARGKCYENNDDDNDEDDDDDNDNDNDDDDPTKEMSKNIISDAIQHLVNTHRVKTDSFRGSQIMTNRKLFPSLSIFQMEITCFQDISSVLLRCNQVIRDSLTKMYVSMSFTLTL